MSKSRILECHSDTASKGGLWRWAHATAAAPYLVVLVCSGDLATVLFLGNRDASWGIIARYQLGCAHYVHRICWSLVLRWSLLFHFVNLGLIPSDQVWSYLWLTPSLFFITAIMTKIEDRTSLDSKSHLPCEVISGKIWAKKFIQLWYQGVHKILVLLAWNTEFLHWSYRMCWRILIWCPNW